MISKFDFKVLFRNIWRHSMRKMSSSKMTTAEKVAAMSPNEMVKNTVRVSDWNKRLLVFAGRFKTMAEIPDILPFEVVSLARNKVRVKVCNYMLVAAVIGSIAMVISGKRAAEAGQSISKMNMDWHLEYKEKAHKVEEGAKKKTE